MLYRRKASTPLNLQIILQQSIEEPPYEQQLQTHINHITHGLQQVQLKAKQNIEVAQGINKGKTILY